MPANNGLRFYFIPSLLREAIYKSGLPKTEVARRVGIHRNTIDAWLRGSDPKASQLLAVCLIIGADINDMYELADKR